MEEGDVDFSDSEDDPVVNEIPVYHSKKLQDQLYIFQYPLRPKNSSSDMSIRKCLVKPQNQEVKLEMDIHMESSSVDGVKAEMIAKNVDGSLDQRKKNQEVIFENGVVDKVTYVSSKAVKNPEKYAVGVFNGKELHLTPLKGILQLRPDFSYLDKTVKRKKDTSEDAYSGDEDAAGPSSTPTAVTVKFKQPANEKYKKAVTASFKSLKQRSDGEPWSYYNWCPENSTSSEIERLKLYCDTTEDVGEAMQMSNSEYIKILVPEDREKLDAKPCLPSHVMSLHALRALPIDDQCKHLLKDAKIIHFQQLLMLLAGGEGLSVDSLLKTLPKVAVLVQGNWIVKSDILYPPGTFSATSGVPADLMCRARDYVLLLFKDKQFVERRKVSSEIRIPSEEIKEIFTGIAKLRHNKGWELTLPPDQEFINKHPEIVQRQNLMWEQRSRQLSEFIKDSKEKRQRRKSKSVSEECKANKSEARDSNLSSDTDSGTEKSKSPIAAKKLKLSKNMGDNKNSKT